MGWAAIEISRHGQGCPGCAASTECARGPWRCGQAMMVRAAVQSSAPGPEGDQDACHEPRHGLCVARV